MSHTKTGATYFDQSYKLCCYPKHTNIDENTRSNKRSENVIAPVPNRQEKSLIATQERQSTANVLVNDLNLSSIHTK